MKAIRTRGVVANGDRFAAHKLKERGILLDIEGEVLHLTSRVGPGDHVSCVIVDDGFTGSSRARRGGDIGSFDHRLRFDPLVVSAQTLSDLQERGATSLPQPVANSEGSAAEHSRK